MCQRIGLFNDDRESYFESSFTSLNPESQAAKPPENHMTLNYEVKKSWSKGAACIMGLRCYLSIKIK